MPLFTVLPTWTHVCLSSCVPVRLRGVVAMHVHVWLGLDSRSPQSKPGLPELTSQGPEILPRPLPAALRPPEK